MFLFYSTFGHTAFLGAPKGPVLAQKGPFGGPRGLRATPGGLICVKLPLAGPTGWAASIPCARSPQETTKALLGPVFGPESHFWWPWRFSGIMAFAFLLLTMLGQWRLLHYWNKCTLICKIGFQTTHSIGPKSLQKNPYVKRLCNHCLRSHKSLGLSKIVKFVRSF